MNALEQRTLANWITMFTIVWEHSDPRGALTSQTERVRFKEEREDRQPPKNWLIWIGANDDPHFSGSVWQRRIGLKDRSYVADGIHHISVDSQLTIFSLNRLSVLVASTLDDKVFLRANDELNRVASSAGFRLLWPMSDARGAPESPARTFALSNAREFLNAMGAIFLLGWVRLP